MFKDVLNHANLSLYAQLGLIIFFCVFAAVVIRALLAPRREVSAWAAMPLSDGAAADSEKEQA